MKLPLKTWQQKRKWLLPLSLPLEEHLLVSPSAHKGATLSICYPWDDLSACWGGSLLPPCTRFPVIWGWWSVCAHRIICLQMISFLLRIHLLMMINGSVTFNKTEAVRHRNSFEAVEASSESYNTLNENRANRKCRSKWQVLAEGMFRKFIAFTAFFSAQGKWLLCL